MEEALKKFQDDLGYKEGNLGFCVGDSEAEVEVPCKNRDLLALNVPKMTKRTPRLFFIRLTWIKMEDRKLTSVGNEG